MAKKLTEYDFIELCVIELKQKYDYNVFEVRRKGLDGFGRK
jgi:hypothetical protein